MISLSMIENGTIPLSYLLNWDEFCFLTKIEPTDRVEFDRPKKAKEKRVQAEPVKPAVKRPVDDGMPRQIISYEERVRLYAGQKYTDYKGRELIPTHVPSRTVMMTGGSTAALMEDLGA